MIADMCGIPNIPNVCALEHLFILVLECVCAAGCGWMWPWVGMGIGMGMGMAMLRLGTLICPGIHGACFFGFVRYCFFQAASSGPLIGCAKHPTFDEVAVVYSAKHIWLVAFAEVLLPIVLAVAT